MRTVSVTTTRTTAPHTALMDSVTPVDLPDIPLMLVSIMTDCSVTVIAIMRRRNAATRSTKTVCAFGLVRRPNLPELAPISAAILT